MDNAPKVTPLHYTYKKPDTDVWVLNFDDIPVPLDNIKDRQIVHLGPQSIGGNHKHQRIEWFVGIGELELVWLDEEGHKHFQHMNPNGEILLIKMPSFLPHAVRNISKTDQAVLIEFADNKMKDVEKMEVI